MHWNVQCIFYMCMIDIRFLRCYNFLAGKLYKYQYRTSIWRSFEGDKSVLDVFKCLIPMVLAVIFVLTAAMFFSMGIKDKENRKVAIIGAIFIELISFTIWIPSLNDLFNIMALAEEVKQILFVVTTVIILLATAIATVFNLKQKT